MQRRARQVVAVGVLTLAALGPTVVVAGSAVAAGDSTVTVPRSQTNWFWREQQGNVNTPATAVGAPSAPDPTVPAGDLVAAGPDDSSGTPDKESYVAFDVAAIPTGSVLSKFVVTVPVDTSAQQGWATSPPALVAVPPKNGWTAGDGASPIGAKPTDDTTRAVTGKYDAAKSVFTFDISSIAQTWVSGDLNFGIGLRLKDGTAPAQVVLGPAKKVTASATFTPAAVTSGPTTPSSSTPSAPVASGTTTGTTSSAVPPSAPMPSVQLPDAAAAPAESAAQAPVVAGQQKPELATTPLAAVPLRTDRTPTTGFWLAALLLVVVLGATSLVLGDTSVAVTVRRDRVLGKVLRTRRGAVSAAPQRVNPVTP